MPGMVPETEGGEGIDMDKIDVCNDCKAYEFYGDDCFCCRKCITDNNTDGCPERHKRYSDCVKWKFTDMLLK